MLWKGLSIKSFFDLRLGSRKLDQGHCTSSPTYTVWVRFEPNLVEAKGNMIQANLKRMGRLTVHYKALAQQHPYWRNFKKSSNFESGFLSITLTVHLVCLLNSQDYDRLHNFFFSFYSLPFFTTLSDICPWVGLVNKTMFPNSYTCRCLSDVKLQLHLHSNALKKKKSTFNNLLQTQ